MDFVENIRVGDEGAETGFSAEIDRAVAIFDPREVGWIGVAEYTPAEGDEARVFLLFERFERHNFIIVVQLPR